MVQPSNNNNGGSDMDSLEDMLRKVENIADDHKRFSM